MYFNIPINLLFCKADLVFASRILHHCRKKLVYRLFSHQDWYLAQNSLLITFGKKRLRFPAKETCEKQPDQDIK